MALVDVVAGLYATMGMLAALNARAGSGEGQRVDVNLLSSVLAAMVNQSSAYVAGGVVPGRMGNAHPSIAPYETLRAADGPLAVAAANDASSRRCAASLGRTELSADPRFSSNPARVTNREELVRELEDALRSCARPSHGSRQLTEAGMACGPVNDIARGVRAGRVARPGAGGGGPGAHRGRPDRPVARPGGLRPPATAAGRAFRRNPGLAAVSITLGGCVQAGLLARSPATCRILG